MNFQETLLKRTFGLRCKMGRPRSVGCSGVPDINKVIGLMEDELHVRICCQHIALIGYTTGFVA